MFLKYGCAVFKKRIFYNACNQLIISKFKLNTMCIRTLNNYTLSQFCSKQVYSAEIEEIMSRCDKDLDIMSVNDKLVRLRNLKQDFEDLKDTNFTVDQINKDERLYKLIDLIYQNMDKLSESNLFFFINTLSFYEIAHPEILNRLSEMILTNKINYRNSKHCKILRFLKKLEEVLLYKNENFALKILVKDFWCFSVLNYNIHSTKFLEQFNSKVLNLTVKDIIADKELAMTMLAYSLIYESKNKNKEEVDSEMLEFKEETKEELKGDIPEFNVEAIKIIIQRIIIKIDQFNYHNLTVVVQSLARMNIRNEKIFTEVASRIMTDIEKEIQIDIKPKESVQIFSSFAKVGFFNLKLMRALEDLFVLNLKSAIPKVVANMLLCHCKWAQHITNETFVEKNSVLIFQSFKEYHIQFIKLLLTDIKEKGIENVDYQTLLLIIGMSNLKHLKDRSNARLIFEIGLKGIDVLIKHLETINEQHLKDVEIMKYYSNLSKITLNKKLEATVHETLNKHNINMEEIISRVEKIISNNLE